MKFDEITVLLGEFGKYQKFLYFVLCSSNVFFGLQLLSSVFTLAIPAHRCKVPGLSNDTFEFQGTSHVVAINRSVPWTINDKGEEVYDSCDLYITNNSTVYGVDNTPINASRGSCDAWVYDISVFSSTFVTETNLICDKEIARANANMILMAGVLVGALAIGIFADIFGRKTALVLSVFLQVGGGFGSAFAPNYALFVTFRFIVGMSSMGSFMSAFVIGMELVGPSKRVVAGIVIEIFWGVGLFCLCLIAYFVRDWNRLQLGIAIPSVTLFLYIWLIPESPRWLQSKGRYSDANKIIQRCAKVNGVKLPDDILSAETADTGEQFSVLKMFTVPRLLIRTLIIYFNWCVVSMVYYGLGLNVGNLDGDIYVNFAINSSMEVGAYLLCLLTLNKIGRKPLYAGTMILGGLACLSTIFTVLYADESQFWLTLVLANVGKFGISASFAIIFVWTAELLPTLVRNSGMGSSSMFARVGGMICPYIADLGTLVEGDFGKALPLIIFGGLSVLAGILSLWLPETNGRVLPETIGDAERFGKDDDRRKSTSNKFCLNTAYEQNSDPEKFKEKF